MRNPLKNPVYHTQAYTISFPAQTKIRQKIGARTSTLDAALFWCKLIGALLERTAGAENEIRISSLIRLEGDSRWTSKWLEFCG